MSLKEVQTKQDTTSPTQHTTHKHITHNPQTHNTHTNIVLAVQQDPKKKNCYECTLTRQGAQCQCVDWTAKFKKTKTKKKKKKKKESESQPNWPIIFSQITVPHPKKKKKDAELVTQGSFVTCV